VFELATTGTGLGGARSSGGSVDSNPTFVQAARRSCAYAGGMRTLDLLKDAVHLSAKSKALPVFDFGHDYDKYLADFCSDKDPGRLVCLYETKSDWEAWEAHPAGDELVVVVRGKGELIQEIDGQEQRVILGPGQAIINPPGIWHTANVIEPFLALFVTPGPGTTHRPRV
jgi:mannose-6-phosphate isomerase-like protein (cupin superfamily)